MSLSRETVLQALSAVKTPEGDRDIVAAEYVRGLIIDGAEVRFVLEVPPAVAPRMEAVEAQAVAAVEALEGVSKVSCILTAHEEKSPPDLSGNSRPAPAGPQPVPGVRKIIPVASGKGGVGKSTVSVNLAVALAQEGKKVGLLDADVYGPSQPRMLGIKGHPKSPDGAMILPMENHGVKTMSMGLLVREDEAIVWRGPKLMGALQQLLNNVLWGDLDVLIIDMPPGTGDVQLTLAQKTQVDGAIIVSTPQDVALIDARKALDMFRKTGVRVIGMIENMSTHICSQCGFEEHIFGHGGAAHEAKRLHLPFLGEIPLHLSIRQGGDKGKPIVVGDPDSAQAQAFRVIARDLIANGVV